jgi:hypothetical protein
MRDSERMSAYNTEQNRYGEILEGTRSKYREIGRKTGEAD